MFCAEGRKRNTLAYHCLQGSLWTRLQKGFLVSMHSFMFLPGNFPGFPHIFLIISDDWKFPPYLSEIPPPRYNSCEAQYIDNPSRMFSSTEHNKLPIIYLSFCPKIRTDKCKHMIGHCPQVPKIYIQSENGKMGISNVRGGGRWQQTNKGIKKKIEMQLGGP